MYTNYFKFTLILASFLFVTGFISLVVLSTMQVMPARRGLSYEKVTCRITRREIFCERGNCSECISGGTSTSLCLKVYVLCGNHDEIINKNLSSYKESGYLLRKDVYHLNDQCTRKLDSICNSDLAPTPNGLHHFQVGKGKTRPTYQYYRNPNVPDEVVYENHSKEHYRKVVLHSVLWPTALIGLSILIVTAAMCLSPTLRDYRRIP